MIDEEIDRCIDLLNNAKHVQYISLINYVY